MSLAPAPRLTPTFPTTTTTTAASAPNLLNLENNNEEGLTASRLLVSVPETPTELSIELIQRVNVDPSMLTQNPALLELFKPVPWLLPKRYPGLPYSNLSSRDLAVVAAARAQPKGTYEKAISVAFFSKGMMRMLQNCIYTMVKFGGVDNYIIATWSESDLEACLDLNLPCADASRYLPEIVEEIETSGEGAVDENDENNSGEKTDTASSNDMRDGLSIRDIDYSITGRIDRIRSRANASDKTIDDGKISRTAESAARVLLQEGIESITATNTSTNSAPIQDDRKLKSEVPEFESVNYNRIMWLKPAVVAFLLDQNYVVHSTDVDLSYSSKPVWESYLMYLHVAPGAAAVDATFQIEGDGSYGSPINSGNFVALPTEGTKNLFAAWLGLASEKMHQGGNQKGLQKLFNEERYILCRTPQECRDAVRKRDQIAQELLINSTAPPQFSSASSGSGSENKIRHSSKLNSQLNLTHAPTVIRTYTPPWWSTIQNFCVLSGEVRLPEMNPCSPAFFFLHPVCTPKGSDRVGLKTRVLDKAGFWFIDSKYGCPVDVSEMQELSMFYKGIEEEAYSSGELSIPEVENKEEEHLFGQRRRRVHRRLQQLFTDEVVDSPSSEEMKEFEDLVYLIFGSPSVEKGAAAASFPASELKKEKEEEEDDTGFDKNEDLSKYSGRGRQGLERCVPLEVRRPGTEARVARCPLQLAFV